MVLPAFIQKFSEDLAVVYLITNENNRKYKKLIYFSHGCSPDQYTGLDYQYKSHLQKRIEQVVSSTVVMVSLLMMGMYAGIWKVACLFIILIKKYFHSCSLNKINAILNTVPYIIKKKKKKNLTTMIKTSFKNYLTSSFWELRLSDSSSHKVVTDFICKNINMRILSWVLVKNKSIMIIFLSV